MVLPVLQISSTAVLDVEDPPSPGGANTLLPNEENAEDAPGPKVLDEPAGSSLPGKSSSSIISSRARAADPSIAGGGVTDRRLADVEAGYMSSSPNTPRDEDPKSDEEEAWKLLPSVFLSPPGAPNRGLPIAPTVLLTSPEILLVCPGAEPAFEEPALLPTTLLADPTTCESMFKAARPVAECWKL